MAKNLVAAGVKVQHILANGRLEDHADTMIRLMRQLSMKEDMFRKLQELLDEAYERQEERIAYTRPAEESAYATVTP